MDPQLFLNISNRQEALAERLALLLAEEDRGPLEMSWVVVQHRGMERWLRLRIAECSGVAMGLDFPFPRRAVDQLLEVLLGKSPARGFSKENLAWTIFFELPALAKRPEGIGVREYVNGAPQIRRLSFAHTLAAMFDRYMIHRPQMLCEWLDAPPSTGGDADATAVVPPWQQAPWQQALWRRLCEIHGDTPPFPLLHRQLSANPPAVSRLVHAGPLPPRIHVFGISSLPAAFLDVLSAASFSREIHFYLLHPTPLFPGDLQSRRGTARVAAATAESEFPGPIEDFLATTAMPTSDMINLLMDRGAQQTAWDGFTRPTSLTLLNRLQGSLYDVDATGITDTMTDSGSPGPDDDRSIVFVGCSTAQREIEVLYDELLHQFRQFPGLKPGEVLVMAPDIETYAAAIHAVFGNPEPGLPRIPFHVADREPRSRLRGIDAFFAILEIATGRLEAPDIVSLLHHEAVRAAFGFSDGDCEHVVRWIRDYGIRWGLDGAHRSRALGAAADGAGTWARGLAGWVLGIAMDAGRDGLFEQLYPAPDMEGDRIETLGRFLRFFSLLEALVADSAAPRPLAQWSLRFADLAHTLFSQHEDLLADSIEMERVLPLLRDVSAGDSSEPVELAAAAAWLREAVREFSQPGGFLTGGVTFCSIRPMRSIPSRRICLLGMNEGDFPSKPPRARFDLLEHTRERGDRRVREDDLQAFLDVLICARDGLYLSWIDRKADSAQHLPPSPVVAALQTTLERIEGGGHRQPETFSAPLQGFSPQYALAGGPCTFSPAAWTASAAAAQGSIQEDAGPHAAAVVLPEPDVEDRTIGTEEFLRFFDDPALYLLRHRLGLHMDTWEEAPLQASEPFSLDSLAAFRLRREMVHAWHDGPDDPGAVQAKFEALSALPEEPLRAIEMAGVQKNARALTALARENGVGGIPSCLQIDLAIGRVRIRGVLSPLYGGRIVQIHPRKIQARHRLHAWLTHLLANAVEPEISTMLIGLNDERTAFSILHRPLEQSRAAKEKLLEVAELFCSGLCRPLPFFPDFSLQFTVAVRKHGDPQAALEKIVEGWEQPPRHGQSPAAASLHRLLAFPTSPLHDPAFAAMARQVFDPMLDSEANGNSASEPDPGTAG